MKSNPGIFIGTSGWSYDSWKGAFYSENLPKTKYLGHYASRFATVEMNSVFYQLPPAKALEQSLHEVPRDFVFSVKANRYITHIKRLNDGRGILPPFLSRMNILGPNIGPIALQLPPSWGFNRERLKSFLDALPRERRFVFEFHDSSWMNEQTYAMLAEKNAALGIYQAGEKITPRVLTADFVYVRLHKPKVKKGGRIPGLLDIWAEDFHEWRSAGKDVFCYFDQAGDECAVTDALLFREAMESETAADRKAASMNAIGFARGRAAAAQHLRAS